MIQILILAGVALFLILRLKNVLGTRDGFEKPLDRPKSTGSEIRKRNFDVIEGGTTDFDIADHVEVESDAGRALVEMKRTDPDFSVTEFTHGARSAYEMLLMAFENGDLETLREYLSPEVYNTFETVIDERVNNGLTVDAHFAGIRELKLVDAQFDKTTKEADITMRFVGELSSVVKDADGQIVEGKPNELKQQKDVWTFSRDMGSDDPNWLLTGTGG